MQNIGSRKVFCIGLSRTGTTALSHALDSMGIKTIHYSLSAFVQIGELSSKHAFKPSNMGSPYWNWVLLREIRAQKLRNITDILSSYEGFADLPFPFLYQEMSERYPNAKFIYTYRNESNWLKSMKWLIEEGPSLWGQGLLDEEIRRWAYKSDRFNPDELLKIYNAHKSRVFQYFKDSNKFISIDIDKEGLPQKRIANFLEVQEIASIPQGNKTRPVSVPRKALHTSARKFAPLHLLITIFNRIRVRSINVLKFRNFNGQA